MPAILGPIPDPAFVLVKTLGSRRGSLAKDVQRTVALRIDASAAPIGVHKAVLDFTQYPEAELPQILMPVQLTVRGGGTPPTANLRSVLLQAKASPNTFSVEV